MAYFLFGGLKSSLNELDLEPPPKKWLGVTRVSSNTMKHHREFCLKVEITIIHPSLYDFG